jgi:hypothetical protein
MAKNVSQALINRRTIPNIAILLMDLAVSDVDSRSRVINWRKYRLQEAMIGETVHNPHCQRAVLAGVFQSNFQVICLPATSTSPSIRTSSAHIRPHGS